MHLIILFNKNKKEYDFFRKIAAFLLFSNFLISKESIINSERAQPYFLITFFETLTLLYYACKIN